MVPSRRELAGPLTVQDHVQRGPVFNGTAGIGELGFSVYFDSGEIGRHALQANQRSIADQADQIGGSGSDERGSEPCQRHGFDLITCIPVDNREFETGYMFWMRPRWIGFRLVAGPECIDLLQFRHHPGQAPLHLKTLGTPAELGSHHLSHFFLALAFADHGRQPARGVSRRCFDRPSSAGLSVTLPWPGITVSNPVAWRHRAFSSIPPRCRRRDNRSAACCRPSGRRYGWSAAPGNK